MIVPPSPLPERGFYRALYAWLNNLRAYAIAITPKSSRTVEVTRTIGGLVLTAPTPPRRPEEAAGGGGNDTWA